jgi:hypothetical protein
MKKKVMNGQTIPITIEMEFDGTIRNHAILVENQFVPTINNKRKDFKIILDGDPIQVVARFTGVRGSKIKSFKLTINDKTGYSISDIKLKFEQLEIKVPVPYSKFNLIQNSSIA